MTRLGLLRWQLALTWSLAEHHLSGLTDAFCLWAPTPGCFTVRPDRDGRWWPDWDEADPDSAPGVTAGWITWHLGWWWSAVLDHAAGRPPPPRGEVAWPGSARAAVDWLGDLHGRWSALLEGWVDADLDTPLAYPWTTPRPLAAGAAWVNSELMKNVSEIGVLRYTWLALGEPE